MRLRLLTAALVAGALCLAVPAGAEVNQQGNLITTFIGGMSPTTLPRETLAPVAVTVGGSFKTNAHKPLPQLRTISVAINGAGQLDDTGLPVCKVSAIQPATEGNAKQLCHRSIVGTGRVDVGVHLENQEPFTVHANLLAFNGPTENGRKEILAQVYAKDPPGAFVLTFHLTKRPGLFGTVMSTQLPKTAQNWAYLTSFEMTLDRKYKFHGKSHSFVSAACAAPAGFPGAVFPLAKANYGFANGQHLKTTIVRSCRVGK
ncbi:MAG TPA: hypothetical protein VHZ54_11770 [Solirubrobacterales bacterium]|jgi:hypothetical protein|nr:hypothetical protein [Solirubrobacterales bacterium]